MAPNSFVKAPNFFSLKLISDSNFSNSKIFSIRWSYFPIALIPCWEILGQVINSNSLLDNYWWACLCICLFHLVNLSSSQLSKHLAKYRDRIIFTCNWTSWNVVRKVNLWFTFLTSDLPSSLSTTFRSLSWLWQILSLDTLNSKMFLLYPFCTFSHCTFSHRVPSIIIIVPSVTFSHFRSLFLQSAFYSSASF